MDLHIGKFQSASITPHQDWWMAQCPEDDVAMADHWMLNFSWMTNRLVLPVLPGATILWHLMWLAISNEPTNQNTVESMQCAFWAQLLWCCHCHPWIGKNTLWISSRIQHRPVARHWSCRPPMSGYTMHFSVGVLQMFIWPAVFVKILIKSVSITNCHVVVVNSRLHRGSVPIELRLGDSLWHPHEHESRLYPTGSLSAST